LEKTAIYNSKNKWIMYPSLLVASLFLLAPAFYNHYPLVNPDTATYLASGFKPETPMDRPITYGLVIRILSLNGSSLWLGVLAQSAIVTALVFAIVGRVTTHHRILKGFIAVLFLSLSTSISWLASQAQPDVFTSIGFLALALILLGNNTKPKKILLYLLFLVSVAISLSHLLMFGLLLIGLFVLKGILIKKEEYKQLNTKLLIALILTTITIPVMGPALSKSKHIFFTGTLLDKGILKVYLDENCSNNHYKICKYKDALPQKFDDFVWDPASPLYKVGTWKSTKGEFTNINHDILATPKYLKMFIEASARASFRQAATFDIGAGNASFPPGSNVESRIAEYFPREQAAFNASRQNNENMPALFTTPNILFRAIIALSIITLLLIFIIWGKLSREVRLLLAVCILGAVLNIADCAAFSVVNDRYGARVIWLLPLCVIIALLSDRQPNQQNKRAPN
jgi:4-amino-4-deoxy-L-arabinose transferase-like glycosyltransferase